MDPKNNAEQIALAKEILPPQIAEIVAKTRSPFIQAITDVITTKQVFYGGKLILIGDALAGFRPHTASSTSQAALHALLLEDVFTGKMELSDWADKTLAMAGHMVVHGQKLGEVSQYGQHARADLSS